VPTAPALLSGIDTQYNDRTVRPQDDFYRYVNGRWRDAKPDEFARRRSTSAPRPR
jgi:predicted metalloendopeptidase